MASVGITSVTTPVKLLVNEAVMVEPTLKRWPVNVRLPEVIEVKDKVSKNGLAS